MVGQQLVEVRRPAALGADDQEVPVIPLYYLTNQYLFRDDVKGINLNPRNMTMLKGVYVERKGS